MGFFTALKNIVMGKPAFETAPKAEQSQQPGAPQVGSTSSPAATGPKIVPSAYIERTQCRLNGNELECEVTIQNYSHEVLLLDRAEVMGRVLYLNSARLEPGEEKEIILYRGLRPSNTTANECLLFYKNTGGDYFCTAHVIEYEKLAYTTYTIRNIKFRQLRDV